MNLTSSLDIGEIGWCLEDCLILPLTVGLIRLELIDSPGMKGGELYSNYRPQKSFKEEYMCVEGGIGVGRVYTFGKDIFKTKKDAEIALEKRSKDEDSRN